METIRDALGRLSTTIGVDFNQDGKDDVSVTLRGWRGIAVVYGIGVLTSPYLVGAIVGALKSVGWL